MPDNICPKCGKRNKAGAMFCGGCGAPIPGAQDQGSANKTLFMGSGISPPQVPTPVAPAPQAPAQPAPAPQAPAQPAYTPQAPAQPAYTPQTPAQPAYRPPAAAQPPYSPPAAAPVTGPGPSQQIQSVPKGLPSRSRPVAGPMGGGPPSAPMPQAPSGFPQAGPGSMDTVAAGAPGAPSLTPRPGAFPGGPPVASPPVAGPPAASPPMAAPPAAGPPMAAPFGVPPATVSPLSGVQSPPMAAPAPAPGMTPAPGGAPAPVGGAPAPGPDDTDLVGKTLNRRYLVEKHIGEGGFGDVYRAKQIQMDREVAIKVLAPGMTQDENLVARFRREAKSACNLRDPHTIITYDFDETENGLLYIAMELLQGETLFDVMEADTLIPAARVAGILEQSCTSLGEAHAMGIVHRDIKPENIFLEHRPDYPDFVKILDFGIAKIVAGDLAQGPQLTAAGQTLGTLEYMSPEQLMGKELDGRSDMYALGMVAYQMLTGTLPFKSNSPASIIQWHLKELPQPASSLVPTVPQDFDPIILKMIAKDRNNRYSAVSELREDLRQMMARQGWLVGGGSGPMTAVPQAPLPGMPSQPAPVMGSRPVGSDNATAALLPTAGAPAKKSNLALIIVIVVAALGVVGFLLWFFVVRSSGGDSKGSSSKSKTEKGMTVAKGAMKRPAAMRAAAKRPAAMRAVAARPAAMREAPARPVDRKPSLGGLLGVLGGRSSGGGAAGKSVGGLGALLGNHQKLPKAGRITKGRRGRAGVKASTKNPLRVIPPEMTIWGHLELERLRKTRWGLKLLGRIPPEAIKTLASMGLSPNKVDTVALGINYKKVAGGEEEPIMLFAVSGDLKTKALIQSVVKTGAKVRQTKLAGYKVVTKDDLNLVLPSNKLVLFSSKELVQHGLSRMTRKRAKSAVEQGWGKAMLQALGLKSAPAIVLAMAFPPGMQKQTTEVLKQVRAGSDARLLNLMLTGVATKRGLALTLATTCSSTAVAAKLKMMLPLLVKVLAAKVPGPLKSLIDGVRFEVSGKVLALRLQLNEAQIALLATLLLSAAK